MRKKPLVSSYLACANSTLAISALLILSICGFHPLLAQASGSQAAANSAAASATVLHPADLEKIVPDSVFFRGQTASVQQRNSGGVRFADGKLLFVARVDTSGYASDVQDKYQSYLVTEVAVDFGGHTLQPGAYGVGFIGDSKFLVMDLGGNDLFSAAAQRDDALRRPTPLQVMAGASADSYRLYEGRTFVEFKRAGH